MPTTQLCLARQEDLPAMLAIYAPYVWETIISFEVEAPSLEEFTERFLAGSPTHPWVVALREGSVCGFAYASPLFGRAGYNWCVETSVYVRQGERGGGTGRTLYSALLALLANQGYCEAYAKVALPNGQSEGFHQSMGFVQQGFLQRPGRKFGKVVGVALYAYTLRQDSGDPPPVLPIAALPGTEVQRVLGGPEGL